MAAGQQGRHSIQHAPAESIEPGPGRGTAPRHEKGDGYLAPGKVQTYKRRLDRRRNGGRVDDLLFQPEGRRNHWNVAQRKNVERRNVDRAAADLRRILGCSDYGRSNSS